MGRAGWNASTVQNALYTTREFGKPKEEMTMRLGGVASWCCGAAASSKLTPKSWLKPGTEIILVRCERVGSVHLVCGVWVDIGVQEVANNKDEIPS